MNEWGKNEPNETRHSQTFPELVKEVIIFGPPQQREKVWNMCSKVTKPLTNSTFEHNTPFNSLFWSEIMFSLSSKTFKACFCENPLMGFTRHHNWINRVGLAVIWRYKGQTCCHETLAHVVFYDWTYKKPIYEVLKPHISKLLLAFRLI